MFFKLLACETFTREICACMAGMPHVIDLEFTAIGSHDQPDALRKSLQKKIDSAEQSGRGIRRILLCYGLCGNATAGLAARSTQLVVPARTTAAPSFSARKTYSNNILKNARARRFSRAARLSTIRGPPSPPVDKNAGRAKGPFRQTVR